MEIRKGEIMGNYCFAYTTSDSSEIRFFFTYKQYNKEKDEDNFGEKQAIIDLIKSVPNIADYFLYEIFE